MGIPYWLVAQQQAQFWHSNRSDQRCDHSRVQHPSIQLRCCHAGTRAQIYDKVNNPTNTGIFSKQGIGSYIGKRQRATQNFDSQENL